LALLCGFNALTLNVVVVEFSLDNDPQKGRPFL
jgi:hypothetical protein